MEFDDYFISSISYMIKGVGGNATGISIIHSRS